MTTLEICLTNLGVVVTAASLLWLLSLAIADVSIVDIFWGPAFALIAWSGFVLTPDTTGLRKWLIVTLCSVWALRLAGYLAWRNLGKGEDYRYRAMRERTGPSFRWISLFKVFWLQAILAWIVSLPLQLGQIGTLGDPWQLTPLMIVGCALFAVGLFFETVGDLQLARFKADPANAGKVMDRGLWRYTRHPNYFGDFTVWWGFYALALAAPSEVARMGWTIIGPALMSFLLLRVSGVSLLEKSLKKRRPDYQEYIRRTSAFFPRPPRP